MSSQGIPRLQAEPVVLLSSPGYVLSSVLEDKVVVLSLWVDHKVLVLSLWVSTPLDQMTLSQGAHIQYPAHQLFTL